MPAWVKKAAQYVLFLGIGLALLYLTFKNVNPVDLWENLKAVSGGAYRHHRHWVFGHHFPRPSLGTNAAKLGL
jgi:hypothetical protein